MNLPVVLSDLAVRRPGFHSEADFQHELAWAIQTKYAHQKPELRLEYPLLEVRHQCIEGSTQLLSLTRS